MQYRHTCSYNLQMLLIWFVDIWFLCNFGRATTWIWPLLSNIESKIITVRTIWAASCKNRPFDSCRCHTKKKAWLAPAQPSFLLVGHQLWNCSLLSSQIILHSRCYTKRRLGKAGAKQALFSYDNDKDLKKCFCKAWLKYLTLVGGWFDVTFFLLVLRIHHN